MLPVDGFVDAAAVNPTAGAPLLKTDSHSMINLLYDVISIVLADLKRGWMVPLVLLPFPLMVIYSLLTE